MKLRLPGDKRPMSSEARAGLGAAFVLLALISAIEVADGPEPHYIGLLASAPFLVATFAAWLEVLVIGGLATALGVAFGSYPHGLTMPSAVQIGAIMAATAIAAMAGTVPAGQAERLGSYRHVAYERADLRAIVADLDRAVARSVGDEDFVTAALVEERGGTLTIVNCGHPAPLLLRRGEVIPLEPPANAPPLGFMPVVRPRVERLEPGDRLLLYTDGLAEARREGEFFPTAERAWRLLGHGTVGDGLASLESALVEWVHGRLDDDIALVLMEYAGAQPATAAAGPSWEVGTDA